MKKPLTVPTFEDEAQEAEFWANLDLSEYFEPSDFTPGQTLPELQHSAQWAASRVTRHPATPEGEPVVRGTRIPLWLIRDFLAMGVSPAQIVLDYPPLTGADLVAIAIYAADHDVQHPSLPPQSGPHRDRPHLFTEAELGYPTEAQGVIPAFHNRIEEAAFWDTHDITDELIEDIRRTDIPGDEKSAGRGTKAPSRGSR